MNINNKTRLSYEFFPPKTEQGVINLQQTRIALAKYHPEFYSVTFGAGGTAQDTTINAVSDIRQQSDISACPHISCIGSSKASISKLLAQYIDLGINRLVALRGDLPAGVDSPGEFKNAAHLVEFIRQQTGDHFTIAVAAYPEMHPEASHYLEDFNYFKAKMDAGADFAITQYFYNADAFNQFRELCVQQQINKPIVPGIMPISNFANLRRFSGICGAEIPRWICKSMDSYEAGSAEQKALGHDIVTNLINQLQAQQVDGFHFYTMNKHEHISQLIHDTDLL